MNTLNNIPDYSGIKKLASALHKAGANRHGAAIMIGAGFSRSAATHVDGEKKMPLWNSFSKKLVNELNPNNKDTSFSDPLRVAEEYRAYFGQSALSDQIRNQIDDEAWRTGDLYQLLLELPWSEVMTTNWDTLLERAARDVHGPYYTTVCKPSDLSWAPSPRIVKLHGTIGVTEAFIAAQEDYRTYPEKFAPFVNFARQVFIENELCLLGFSGEDPNFLQWAGWVRDQLADQARKIYLVGALNLTASQRVYLESIHIAPIDLWPAVREIQDPDLRHQTATSLFLQSMREEGKVLDGPIAWTPSNLPRPHVTADNFARELRDPECGAQRLKEHLNTLQRDRETYPGWLVCPPALRLHVKFQLSSLNPTPQNIAALAQDDRSKLLYEIAWRHGVTFEPIGGWLSEALLAVANQDDHCILTKRQQMEIALVLLNNSRWMDIRDTDSRQVVEEYVRCLTDLLDRYVEYLPDSVAEVAYYKALVARDSLDYSGIAAVVEKITGQDPVWKLRQAALFVELGRFDRGTKLVATAYGELRENHRRDQRSIAILSRLLWAHFLLQTTHIGRNMRSSEELPAFAESNYRKWKCDPWICIQEISDKTISRREKQLKSQNPIEPLFEQGFYRDRSSQRTFGNETPEEFLLDGITRSVGIPLRMDGAPISVDLLARFAEKLVLYVSNGYEFKNYTLAIRAAQTEQSPSINEVFTRIGVACAARVIVDFLVDRLIIAISYWCEQRRRGRGEVQQRAISALRVLIEVLARLTVRVSTEKATEIFRMALSIGQQKEVQDQLLLEVIEDLLTNSLRSIPESDQGVLLTDCLMFPLDNELLATDWRRWPNPIVNCPYGRSEYNNIDDLISRLIADVVPHGTARSRAALERLLPLAKKEGFLAQKERDSLIEAIWGSPPNYDVIPETGLFPHVLLIFPSGEQDRVSKLVRECLYENDEDLLKSTQKQLQSYPDPEIDRVLTRFAAMTNAATGDSIRLLPTSEQATTWFDNLVQWRPQSEKDDILGFAIDYQKKLTLHIGNSLSYALAPALSMESKTVARFEQLEIFYETVEMTSSALPAFIYFAAIDEHIGDRVENVIRKALQARNVSEVSSAAYALHKWVQLSGTQRPQQLDNLVSRVIVILETGRTVGLQHLIWLTEELLRGQWLSKEQLETLREAIPNAFDGAKYAHIDPMSQEAITASSIRQACVKVSKLLINYFPQDLGLQDLLSASREDALPEVRFAF